MRLALLKEILIRAWHLRRWRSGSNILERPLATARFLLLDRETTNFTYDISNEHELLEFIADALGRPLANVQTYARELHGDDQLRGWLRAAIRKRRDRNVEPRYGRRLGWYCLTRLTRPRLVIETGTHDGLGSCLFARALQRNHDEGHAGQLLSFDIDPGTGWLLPQPLLPFVRLVRGDIRQTLLAQLREAGPQSVDLFLHDSDHRYEHEVFEIEATQPFLSPTGILLSDNAHDTSALRDFSRRHGFSFGFWREQPRNHPYPGAGLGLARPGKATNHPNRAGGKGQGL